MSSSHNLVSGSEAGSYLRLIDFVYHSTLGVRVIKKQTRARAVIRAAVNAQAMRAVQHTSLVNVRKVGELG